MMRCIIYLQHRCLFKNELVVITWSYRGVVQEESAVLGRQLELRGKLKPWGGTGFVHISGNSEENVSNPPINGKQNLFE